MSGTGWFTGKIASVTGAGTGLGLAIATALGRQGAKVMARDRTVERASAAEGELTSRGIAAVGIAADVTKRPRLWRPTIGSHGRRAD